MASKPSWIIIKRPTEKEPIKFYVRKNEYAESPYDAAVLWSADAWDRVLAEPEDVQVSLDVVRRSEFIGVDEFLTSA